MGKPTRRSPASGDWTPGTVLGGREVLDVALRAVVVATLVMTLLGFAGRAFWWCDLLAQVPNHLALVGIGSALGLTWCRSWRWLPVAVACVVINGVVIWDYREPPVAAREASVEAVSAHEDAIQGATAVRVFYANVLRVNEHAAGLLAQIDAADPDLVVLLEVDDRWLDDLAPLAADYPWSTTVPRDDNFGIAVYSRLPVHEEATIELFVDGLDVFVPAIELEVEAPWGPVRVLAVHAVPPVSGAVSRVRDAQLDQISAWVQETAEDVIVVGDLNVSTGSTAMRDFLVSSGLSGGPVAGWWPWTHGTWPVGLPPPLRLALDYCLTSEGLVVHELRTGDPFGSDHVPFAATIEMVRP